MKRVKENQGKKKTKIPTNDPNAKPLENLFLPFLRSFMLRDWDLKYD